MTPPASRPTATPTRRSVSVLARISVSFLLALFSLMSSAQTYTPVALTGFNADVIANGATFAGSTTADVDGGNYTFLNQTFTAFGTPTFYLPSSGTINSAATAGLTFQLANATGFNSLRLSSTVTSGTLTFGSAQNAGIVYVLATSGASASTVNISVNFSDATSQNFTGLNISDWYDGNPFVISGIGRVNGNGSSLDGNSTNPRLYQLALALTGNNVLKPITSITVTKTNATGFAQIMGVSLASACAIPAAQPTGLTLTAVSPSQIDGSFTAASPAADQYLVVRYPTGSTPTDPTHGVTYTPGTQIGTGTVVYSGTATTFNATGLSPATGYTFYVYSLNSTNCVGPVYRLQSPLTASQTSNTCGNISGTIPVGPSATYTSITAALASLASGVNGPVVLELQSGYTSAGETFPINFNLNPCFTAANTLTVRPAAGATGLVITSSNTTATIDLNGAKYVRIDGRPGGTGSVSQLSIINTAATGLAVRFVNDAQFNTITYCDIQGQNTTVPGNPAGTTVGGVIYFGGTTTLAALGNDNNTISFSSIHATAGGNPAYGILAAGSTATVASYNDNNTITGCNIYDFFSAGSATTAIKLDAGTNAWTISNNHFYQTAIRTYTTANTHRILWITPNTTAINNTASGFIITGNFIGGSAPNAAGVYTMAGTVNTFFVAMDLSVGYASPTSVQNNTITNFDINTTTQGFVGISQANGNIDIGTVTGNVVGSATGTNSIKVTVVSGGGATITGYRSTAGTNAVVNIANNTFGSINAIGTATLANNIIGISVSGGTNATNNITNNLIGSLTTANSVNASFSTTGTQSVTGINVSAGAFTTISGNTIANLNNAFIGTGTGTLRGINVTTSAATITNNMIRELSSTSQSTSTGLSAAITGITNSSTTTGVPISGNTIHSLRIGSSSAASNVVGIVFSGSTTVQSLINKNFIHSFDITTANTTITLTGVDYATGLATFANNMIRLGVRPDGTSLSTEAVIRGISSNSSSALNNFYFNSIYIGGTGVGSTARNTFAFTRTSTSGTYDIRNNIFVNNRSNAAAGGKHYAILFTTNTTGVTEDYNVYFANGTGGVFANNGTADVTAYTSGWIAGDVHSLYGDPLFVAPSGTNATVDLHVQQGTNAEGTGIDIPGITDDYDGQVRANFSPVDIGADAGNFGVTGVDVGVVALVTPATGVCYGATETVSVRIRNYSANTINFATNNVTANVTASGPVTYTSSFVINTGTLASGATMVVTLPATINMSAPGTYTFNASTSSPADLVASNNAMGTDTRTVVAGASLSGSYNVGAGQAATGGYNTITDAVTAYNNAACLAGNVVFNLVDANYTAATGETFPIVINSKTTANTLTIKPAPGIAVNITGTSGTTVAALIKLAGADNVTIDGLNTGGSSLSIENTSTTGGATVIWLASQALGNGATNNVIRNLNLKGGVDQTTSTTNTYGIVVAGNTLSATHTSITAGDDNDNNTIEKNNIIKARYAIFTRGGSTVNPNFGTIIRNNILGPTAFGVDELGRAGIVSREEDGMLVTGNEIRYAGGLIANNTTGTDRAGIAFTTDVTWPTPTSVYLKNAVVTNNNIHHIVEERTFSAAAIILAGSDGTNATNNLVANNFIYSILANGTSGDQTVGIGINAGAGDRIVYNSIYLTGDVDPSATASATTTSSFGISITSTSVLNAVVKDNIVFMDLSSSSGGSIKNAAINIPASFVWGTGGSNYNDLYITASNTQSNIGTVNGSGGTYYTTLATWQAATGQDLNSISVLPPFVSPTNLHIDIALGFTIDNLGTPIAGVTTDIDGNTRSASTPDMGADEFTVVTGIDFGATSLVSPVVKSCYSNAETVTIRIRNYSANTHNFALIPVTVSASVTGPNPQTFAPVVVNTGTLAPGDSISVVITNSYNMSALGTYTFDAFTTVPADVTAANNAMVSVVRTLSAVAAGTVTTTSGPFCFTGTPILNLTGSNGNIQWQQSSSATGPWTNVGTNSTSFIPAAPITSSTYYQAVVSCNATSLTTAPVQVVVNTPTVLTSTPATRCGPGTLTLTATASAGTTLNWYTVATGGTPVATGTSFTTPIINATTTYYVAAEIATPACASNRTAVIATVNAAPAFDITNDLTVCNNAITTFQVTTPLANFNTYSWTPAAGLFTDPAATIPYTAGSSATTLYAKLATAGTSTFIATANNTTTACQNIDSVRITVLPATITVNPTPDQICVSGTSTLSIAPSVSTFGNATYQWSSSTNNVTYTAIAGATSATYTTPTISTTTFYKVDVKNSAGVGCLSAYDTVIVNNPQILTTTPATVCGTNTVTLNATASNGAVINWYTAATGGTLAGTGSPFTTPALSASTTYYASAVAGNSSYTTGLLTSAFIVCGAPTASTASDWPLRFTTTKPTVINSAYVIPAAAGTFTAALRASGSASNITTATFTFTAAQIGVPVQIPLGFSIPAAGTYQLTNSVGGGYRIATFACGYPFTTPGGGFSVTGSATSSTATSNLTTYNIFYELNVSEACESPRVAVQATVNTVTAITTQPTSQAICAGSNVSFTVVAAGTNLTYQWKKGATAIAGATSATYTINNAQVSDAGAYTVDVTGACGPVTSTVANLSVSASNSWLGAVSTDWNDGANWCGPVPTPTTDVTIPSGTPFSPVISGTANVRNLTINTGATLALSQGAQFNVYGNYSNTGTFNAPSGFIYFRGAANQTIGALTAANVVVNGAGGITLVGNMTVTTLILQNGNITLGTNTLTTTGSVNGTVASHIVTNGTGGVVSNNIGAGPVIIPVGPDAATYNPVMIANGQGRNYTVKVATGITPAIQDPTKAVNRTWSVTANSAVTSDVSVTLQFANAHGNANFIPTGLVEVGLNQGSIWQIASPPNGLTPLGGITERQVTVQTQQFGSFVISTPGGLNLPTSIPPVNSDITSMRLLPNPVQSSAILRVVTARAVKMQWRITDVSGRIVRTFDSQLGSGMNDVKVLATMLSSGTYFLTGSGEKGRTSTIRFIKL